MSKVTIPPSLLSTTGNTNSFYILYFFQF